ncbi:MAG TPA: 5-(carboxyamino)imidazole ribonucleotide synthase [Bacteroidia bacterium]|nr:5-(carboxyamino)imidazole ribonucleotide synthase [Bacteroidia bacterium]
MSSFLGSKTRIGILGGGQLGRMLIQKAIDFNITTIVLDPDVEAPCAAICDIFLHGDFRDYDAVMRLGELADVITVEIEHVNVEALEKLEAMGKKVYPQPAILRMVQDKGLQKTFYREHGIPTAPFVLVNGKKEVESHVSMFPVMQKTRKAGYDGKGVVALKQTADTSKAFDEPSVLEQFVDMDREVSCIVSRNAKGEVAVFPLVEMEFNAEANLVEFLFSPAVVDDKIAADAAAIATGLINKLEMVGLLAVEMFITKKGEVLVNEIAPRPHNSGHQTIEGNVTSQYEQHLRAILDMPFGDTSPLMPSVMVNLLGEKGYSGPAVYEGFSDVMALPGAHIHLYGKKLTKPFRKMGHATVTAASRDTAFKIAKQIQQLLKIKA